MKLCRVMSVDRVSRAASAVLLLLLCGDPWSWAAGPQDAVVSIWATPSSGSPWIGTGFFVSKEGDVLTCYHVVRNAQKLIVYRGTQGYSDIEVVAISPQHDLALLRINHLQPPISFLHLSEESPSEFLAKELTVYGNLTSGLRQKVPATATAPDYVPSGKLRSPEGGYRIFDLPEVKLIALQMIIYDGFSGGPVLSGEGVVGVISGSFNQGGTIAWAIPSIYASADQMSALHQPLGKVGTWPKLDLIQDQSRWNTLRQGLSLSTGLNLAINAYVTGLDDATATLERVVAATHDEDEKIGAFVTEIAIVAKAHQEGTLTPEQVTAFSLAQASLLVTNANFMAQGMAIQRDIAAVEPRVNELAFELEKFVTSLPNTPKNKKNIEIASRKIIWLSRQIHRTAKAFDRDYREYIKKVDRLDAKIKSGQSPEERIVLLTQMRTAIDDFVLDKSQNALLSMVSSLREMGDVAKALVDLDVPPGGLATSQ